MRADYRPFFASPFSAEPASHEVVAEFAEQFSIDVSAITGTQRSQLWKRWATTPSAWLRRCTLPTSYRGLGPVWKRSASINADVAAGVREHFTGAEAVELTLDVMRNASNKVAVALDDDVPRVEQYLLDVDGQTVFS